MKNKNIIKKVIIGVSGLLLVGAIGIGSYIGNYFYDLALNPDSPKDAIFGNGDDETDKLKVQEDEDWLIKNSNYKDKYITSSDNLKLHAYEVINKNKTNKWAIVVHGYTSEGKLVSPKAKYFYEMGYNVLVPDLRGHGKSEGDYIGMGWDDRLDIIAWANSIIKSNKNSEIVLHGTSMGSATVLMVSGEDLPSNIKAIVADCGYTSAWNEFVYQLNQLFGLKPFPVMQLSNIVTKIKAGYSLKDASALEQVKKSKTPILFIHGDKDDFVPYSMMEELYDATNCEKEKLTIKGAGHDDSYLVNPKLYWTTIYDFINKYVK